MNRQAAELPGHILYNGINIPIPSISLTNLECYHRHEFFRRAFGYLQFNEISGDYAEFGSGSASTIRLAWDTATGYGRKTKFWSFDSFAGLPDSDPNDEHPKWTKGNYSVPISIFRQIVERHGIPASDYTAVEGFYSDTIGPNAKQPTDFANDIGLVYIDCDMYSSTKDAFHFLKGRLKHGMIIAFDDYFCFSERQISGERLAMLEFLETDDRFEFVPFFPINWHGNSFIVERKSLRIKKKRRIFSRW